MLNEMDKFIDWNQAGVPEHDPLLYAIAPGADNEDVDLFLANFNDDGFDLGALDHVDDNEDALIAAIDLPMDGTPALDLLEHTDVPCLHCDLGAYSCKKIREGRYRGYCTSCVALGVECSFAGLTLDAEATTLPANPWPVIGHHPLTTYTAEPLRETPQMTPTLSLSDLLNPSSSVPAEDVGIVAPRPGPPPKIGARFSRESLRILKNWLSSHNRHPYPSDEEKEALQRQTGLNKTQITNWLANARRRGKVQPPRSTSPHVGAWAGPIEIPARRGTPAVEAMNPLQRWEHSPPEHEAASVTAIARAVTASSSSALSSRLNSPFSLNYTDDGSNRSLCNQSSTSSLGTSQSSNGSRSSAYSARGRRRRRRRAAPKHAKESTTSLTAPLKTFQCTFCTDTFRTKHDWQRHEKSLHLSLERWHLRLVHNVKFADWSMRQWKVASPEIRSRCGFCGIVMDTWTIRVDHLAEHFKTGYSMADWKGDWGFDVPVLDMVENSIPPYLIHHERISPLPYVASHSPPESPRNAYELIKLELAYFGANYWEQHQRAPTDEEMQLEGCRVIFASELLSLQGVATQDSWFRDLIMSSMTTAKKARFGPLRGAAESRLASLKINGKDNLFEACPMEIQLQGFVKAKQLLGLTTMDDELQEEACKIVGRVEEVCTHPSESVANWLLRLITTSTDWLADFRRRAHLPRTEDVQDMTIRSTDPKSIDSTIHSYSRLERELTDFLRLRRSAGVEPTDEDLQKQARIIIYEFDDGWNQTAADNFHWLEAFKQRHPPEQGSPTTSMSCPEQGATQPSTAASDHTRTPSEASVPAGHNDFSDLLKPGVNNNAKPMTSFLNDANCYLRLAKEMRRWVKSTMSPNNPNRHVPTDEELQYQARWILYDDDDPWNQTAADNAEWLQRFKRDVGIVSGPGPGLPPGYAWALEQGGTGFAPPYAFPKGHVEPFEDNVRVNMRQGAKSFGAGQCAANSFLETLTSDNCRLPSVFCSRELEGGLIRFVDESIKDSGRQPTDEAIQAKAREIAKSTETAADDPVLLGKFKEWIRDKLPHSLPAEDVDADVSLPCLLPTDMEVDISDEQLGDILQGLEFDVDPAGTNTIC
ncbi:tc5 transposase DNA-binding domain-containing protein [Hirsutella rhossiliensis]|uniref:Tc5 transposase DNA-binding domain-containing protein n=1 Tax=Hirsutella rhossiliensis TaxID=111463 RepID=A0A9P8SJ69_9HYPO|nr:tc5 transposase DNA-binding domain-containing protein [Hirsutella rhossiliensis]KAH0964576.1 tc5 transposase DNA-binding domain-containing protein [Hirsutella rhossiliensis]